MRAIFLSRLHLISQLYSVSRLNLTVSNGVLFEISGLITVSIEPRMIDALVEGGVIAIKEQVPVLNSFLPDVVVHQVGDRFASSRDQQDTQRDSYDGEAQCESHDRERPCPQG